MNEPRPAVRLRPGVPPQPVCRGEAPWVYADQLVLDRRTRAIPAGSLVALQDAERVPLALAAFNPGSKIAARILDPDPGAEIGRDWFAARLARALAEREVVVEAHS
jgi:23S rRNA (cytosine1962-C5)-methyltransferase